MTTADPTRRAYLRRGVAIALALVTMVSLGVYLTTLMGGTESQATLHRGLVIRAGSSRHSAARPRATPVEVYRSTSTVRPAIRSDLSRVYVPSGPADTVTVIDPATKRIISQFSTGRGSTPQHIVPSFDLRSLWVLLNKGDHVMRIDPHDGSIGPTMPVNDPYNMYFTPDGASAIIVAELHSRLDFRDPHSMALQGSVDVPGCRGLNHADYSADLRSLLLTCEFSGTVVKVDVRARRVIGTLQLRPPAGQTPVMSAMPDHSTASSMPQDIRLGPHGQTFYVADMLQGGLHVIDAARLRELGFIRTGVGAHSVTPSHDGRLLYVANRGTTSTHGAPHGPGSVSVIETATDRVIATWPVPGGGSPDMGNLTADGKELWLSGRFDSEVYAFDTATGALAARIHVPRGPHGLAVWPLPGRFSLGHTGNMR